MPRQARLDVPGALHHIIVRGINRSAIFQGEEDRSRFLTRLAQNLIETKSLILAWVIMDTHVHLLVRSGKQGISTLMRKLLTWYAVYYNRRHQRTGHLFDNRYKSILCDEESYFLPLLRYIHLNPVRARIVSSPEDLERYPWCGHRMILGKEKYPWMDVDQVLAQFGDRKKKAMREYRRFLQEGFDEGHNPMLTGGGLLRSQGGWSGVLALQRRGSPEASDERILGGGSFVDRILREAEEHQLRQTRLRRKGRSVTEIIEKECRQRKVNVEEMRKGSRRTSVSIARAAIACRLKQELGFSGAAIARHLGVNTSSINRALARMDEPALT